MLDLSLESTVKECVVGAVSSDIPFYIPTIGPFVEDHELTTKEVVAVDGGEHFETVFVVEIAGFVVLDGLEFQGEKSISVSE